MLAMSAQQKEPLSFAPKSGITFVNQWVHVQTAGTQHVISIRGVIIANYDVTDRGAEAFAILTLRNDRHAGQHSDPPVLDSDCQPDTFAGSL